MIRAARPRRSGRFSARGEALIGLGTYGVYLLVRQAVVNDRGRRAARRNARRLVSLERRLGLHLEPRVQGALLRRRRLIEVANVSYVTLNVGLTVGWLALLYLRRDPRFHRLRSAWVIATLGAQPCYLLLPTAPPRTLDAFTDTIRDGGWDLDSGPIARLYDPLAAMPSIHVAYAVLTSAGMVQAARSPHVRALAPAYAPGIALVVLATANHYLLDIVAGAALAAASLRLARVLDERSAPLRLLRCGLVARRLRR